MTALQETRRKIAGRRPARYKREMTKSIHVGGRPVWAEISLKAILRNLEIIREHVNGDGGAREDQGKKSRQNAGATGTNGKNAGRRPAVQKTGG